MNFANKKVTALITGASGTFGSSIARALTRTALNHDARVLNLLLHGRPTSASSLDSLSASLMELAASKSSALTITQFAYDLCDSKAMAEARRLLHTHSIDADFAFLFNNAGVLRPTGTKSFDKALLESFAVNAIAPAHLCNVFIDVVPKSAQRVVVLTSSLAAVQPLRSWGAYCASKAAAEMAHRVVAAERTDLRVLCYAPGPMLSHMTSTIATDFDVDPQLRALYAKMQKEKSFVNPEESAETMTRVLIRDEYASGKHVDFYDF